MLSQFLNKPNKTDLLVLADYLTDFPQNNKRLDPEKLKLFANTPNITNLIPFLTKYCFIFFHGRHLFCFYDPKVNSKIFVRANYWTQFDLKLYSKQMYLSLHSRSPPISQSGALSK